MLLAKEKRQDVLPSIQVQFSSVQFSSVLCDCCSLVAFDEFNRTIRSRGRSSANGATQTRQFC
jgi:hypothetical protein